MSARCLFAAVWLTISSFDATCLLAQDPPQAEITSQADVEPSIILGEMEPAIQLAVEKGQPILILFSADWCHWCHQLVDELNQETGTELRSSFVVVELDIDLQPKLASRFQAETLPALRLVDPELNLIASTDGYRPIPELLQWLREQTLGPSASFIEKLAVEAEWDSETLNELRSWLVHPSPKVRRKTIDLIKPHAHQARLLIPWLSEGRLIQRLTILELLKLWQAPVQDFNPWEPSTLSSERLDHLREWAATK